MATLDEERANAGLGGAAALRQRLARRRRKKIRPLAKCGVVLLDIVGKRRDPWPDLNRAGGAVERRHRAAERIGERTIDFARLRQPVEGCVLIEAAHFEHPFHRGAGTVEDQPAVGLPRDRGHAAVNVGRE